ncbi:hypothetical protein AB1Y20_003950 [Prymnesium parvum]|uniref:Tc1-like transposase DDE domain-containing protein n=1 Tax=Prymnesium parvum TaxID=97485 RepID=A0AB34J632_PRYPA
MPRLRLEEPPQRGKTTGAPLRFKERKKVERRTRGPPPPPPWAARAARSKRVLQTDSGRKRSTFLSPDEQASMLMQYAALPTDKRQRSAPLKKLCRQYNVSESLPRRHAGILKKSKKLPTRKGKAGRPKAVTPECEQQLIAVLKEHAYDLTFRQIEELTGISATTAWRHMKTTPGWRVTSKSCKPYLTDDNVQARLKWARSNRTNRWKHHVDVDEKWFYVYSHSGKLKLPPGTEKPRTPMKSKRFIGKIMCLIAIGRPSPGNCGLIGCWRVTEPHIYKRRTEYRGVVYNAGDSRRVDANMDSAKWLEMIKNDVLPAIASKAPDTKFIQWDNATPHTAENAKEVANLLLQYGLTRVVQCPNSPDTNALDLGFNKSLDSRLPRVRSYDLDEFERQIVAAFGLSRGHGPQAGVQSGKK